MNKQISKCNFIDADNDYGKGSCSSSGNQMIMIMSIMVVLKVVN